MLKRILIAMVTIALIAGCTVKDGQIIFGELNVPPCILHTGQPFKDFCEVVNSTEGRESLICSIEPNYGVDPCTIYRGAEIVAKEGALFEAYTVEEFSAWTQEGIRISKSGITFNDVKAYILAQVMKLNKLVGAQVMMMGDLFVYVDGDAIVKEDDALILESVFLDLDQEVQKMKIFVSEKALKEIRLAGL